VPGVKRACGVGQRRFQQLVPQVDVRNNGLPISERVGRGEHPIQDKRGLGLCRRRIAT
jgi:hypothetical protein